MDQTAVEKQVTGEELPFIPAKTSREVFADRNRDVLNEAILRYVRSRRWFGGKARTVTTLQISDVVPLSREVGSVVLVDIEYADGEPDRYLLPLSIAQARRAEEEDRTATLIARLRDGCLLYESVHEQRFARALLEMIGRRRSLKGEAGTVAAAPTRVFRELVANGDLHPQPLKGEQSNTAIVYGERLFLKLFRRLQPGVNTDLEVTRFLNEETSFDATPRVAGAIEYRSDGAVEPTTLAILQSYTRNAGDAWRHTLDVIGRFFERVLSDPGASEQIAKATPTEPLVSLVEKELPAVAKELIAGYLADAETLGRRTAQMHLALASRTDIPAFAPEPLTPHYQRSLYQHIRAQAVQTLQLTRRRAKGLAEAEEVLAKETAIQQRIRSILDRKIGSLRIRIHGDYHLGQLLYTGNDFVIIDFEGEPSRPLSERRIKRSALRDVAGMLRSFHYAPYAVIFGQSPSSVIRPEDLSALEHGARFWQRWVSARFLRAYLDESAGAAHLPSGREEMGILLDAYLLEKVLFEIVYELNHRPDWLRIPLRGVLDLLA